MNEITLVADASVIVKWFLVEDYSEDAIRVKTSHVNLETKVVVPTLARYEILNALKYSNKFGTQEMCQITNDLESYQFFEVPLDGEIGEAAVRIASDFGITIYDSSYIAVGKVRKLDVFTADQKLLDKVPELDFVHHLKDYNGNMVGTRKKNPKPRSD